MPEMLAERILDLITRAVRSGSLSEHDKALGVLDTIRMLCSVELARQGRSGEGFVASVYGAMLKRRESPQTDHSTARTMSLCECSPCGRWFLVEFDVEDPVCPACGRPDDVVAWWLQHIMLAPDPA